MKCRACNSVMVVDRSESSAQAVSRWHHCPLCKTVRLTSEPAPDKQNPSVEQLAAAALEVQPESPPLHELDSGSLPSPDRQLIHDNHRDDDNAYPVVSDPGTYVFA